MDVTNSKELHDIRAHQLYYSLLLDDFRRTVNFIRNTRNPVMDTMSKLSRSRSADLMRRECDNLLAEIDRLDGSRQMVDHQLKNAMNLVGTYYDCSRSNQPMLHHIRYSAALLFE
jgi:hypothetical protein